MKERKDKISIIVPCYNEEEMIPIYFDQMEEVRKKFDNVEMEYVFIDDGSKDKTLCVLRQLAKDYTEIRYIALSRNFGKEAAMFAGLEASQGDYIVIMDVDLQDPPELIPEMYGILQEGKYDCVASRRVTRKGEAPIRSLFARLFYKLINKISDTEIVDGARDFRMMTKKMADALLEVREYNRFSKGIFEWVGFETKWLEYENRKRVAGESKWSFWKLFCYSIEGITAFSMVPLSIAAFMGIGLCLIAFFMIAVIITRTLMWGDPVSGWPSMACIVMFVGGIQLFCIGILGQYLSKAYLETKKRPIYIVKETDENI